MGRLDASEAPEVELISLTCRLVTRKTNGSLAIPIIAPSTVVLVVNPSAGLAWDKHSRLSGDSGWQISVAGKAAFDDSRTGSLREEGLCRSSKKGCRSSRKDVGLVWGH